MRHDPSLFDARTMRNDTRLEFKLKLLLGTICAYGGEIPLTISEIAERLNTSVYRIRLLLTKLEQQNIIYYKDNKLYFTKYKFIQAKEEYTKEDTYAKNFKFFVCEEFLKENRNVQRFVLHCVGYKLIYLPDRYWWGWYQDLCGEEGILNLRSKKEAIKIVQKASKYLYINMHENNFQVTGVKPEYLEMGFYESEGALLWVYKQLLTHRFCIDFISKKACIQLAKVMEYYYAEYGYEYASAVFDKALHKIQNDQSRSLRFFNLIYRNDEDYIVNDKTNELDEISAYFRAVMETAEIEYAKQLSISIQALKERKRKAEMQLFNKENKLIEENNKLIQETDDQVNEIRNQLSLVYKCLQKRFRKDPDWFVKNNHSLLELFAELPTLFYQIKNKVDEYLRTKNHSIDQFAYLY